VSEIFYPPRPKWALQFVKDPMGVTFNLPKAPNAFHRWMQRVCFGFVWKKI